MLKEAHKILTDVFGYKTFRPLQEEIIRRTLDKKDSLVIMPTGGGKSLCYQIPALVFSGTTIVISPLISLMKDQVEQLKEVGVQAVFLNSSLSKEEYVENIHLLRSGKVKILYIAPETLVLDRTLNLLQELKIDFITVDEAHCISEWGHDFRPEYRAIADIKDKFKNAVCVGLTATATPRVQEDIKKSLRLNQPKDFIASFNRENLYLEIAPKTNGLEQIKRFLNRYPNQSGIIYCFSRKQVDSLYSSLLHSGFSVLPYHAGLTDEERKKNQELFIKDDVQIIVATIAFGMGINKSNVRFVIHHDLPKNIESYYQEIGRSGRDGLRAHCLLLFSYSDTMKIRYFIDQKELKERRIALKHLEALLGYAETGVCRRKPLLTYFGEKYNQSKCGMCDNCNSTDKDLVDVTIPAQKFLSCVKRTKEIFGAAHIIDVLRGSNSAKVIENKHNELSTYGIGQEYTKKQWLYLSHQFIQQQLLFMEEQYKSLKLTDKAYDVLSGNLSISAKIIEDEEPRKVQYFDDKYDHVLFAALRLKRKEIADKAFLPPYVIFSDKSLTDMATNFPTTKAEFMLVHGVGYAKFEKYGEVFINEIVDYCTKHGIKAKGKALLKPKMEFTPTLNKNTQSTGEMFNAGMSIGEIVVATKYKRNTIIKHLSDYVEHSKLKNPERLLEDSFLSKPNQQKVLELFADLGAEVLKPVYLALNEKVNYDELHLLRIYYKAINVK